MGDEHEQQERIPPQDIAAEAAVLGSMLVDSQAARELSVSCRPEFFYRSAHRIIFEAMQGMSAVDEITLRDALGGKLEEIGGSGYLHELALSVPSAANADHYARIVREKWLRRGLIATATAILREADEGMALEVVNKGIDRLVELLAETGPEKPLTIAEALQRSWDQPPAWKIECPAVLQEHSGGIYRGGITMLTGPPKSGKTTLCMQLLSSVAAGRDGKPGDKVHIYSIDMPVEQSAQKVLSHRLQKPVKQLTPEDDSSFVDALPITYYEGSFALSAVVADMHAQASKGVQWFCVDYLSMLKQPGHDDDWKKAVRAVRAFKHTAKELGVYLLVVQSFTRMMTARGGAEIEHAVDQMWSMKRLSIDEETANPMDKGMTTLEITFHRFADHAIMKLDGHFAHNYFTSWERSEG